MGKEIAYWEKHLLWGGGRRDLAAENSDMVGRIMAPPQRCACPITQHL